MRIGVCMGILIWPLPSDVIISKLKRTGYGKCPKISNTKVSDKMTYANSADPRQYSME